MAREENPSSPFSASSCFLFHSSPPLTLFSGGRPSAPGFTASVTPAWDASQRIQWTPQTSFSSRNGAR